jgi:histidinol-phosphate aminotransferase
MEQLLLDRNENQYGPSPACYEVLRNARLEQLSLYSRTYLRGAKSELTERLSRDTGLPEERILLSYGSEDMLKQVVHCYLHEGGTILLPQQSWWYYKSVAAEVSGTQVEYKIRERNETFAYDVNELMELYDRHLPQIILIASPNNPTGNSIAAGDLSSLVKHCSQSVIVLDEAYYGFASASHDHLRELLSQHERLIILRTFSKYYALAGLRIGYSCVGVDLKQIVTFGARYLGYNQLTEKIALAALDSSEYYERTARAIKEDNSVYFEFFKRFPAFTPFRTDANFILVRYPSGGKTALQSGLRSRGVVVKFLDDPGLDDCMRITTGTREQNGRVMSVFREVVGEMGDSPMPTAQPPL